RTKPFGWLIGCRFEPPGYARGCRSASVAVTWGLHTGGAMPFAERGAPGAERARHFKPRTALRARRFALFPLFLYAPPTPVRPFTSSSSSPSFLAPERGECHACAMLSRPPELSAGA